jgi:C4-dicarboxylate-specific signal transduction histidine kinase
MLFQAAQETHTAGRTVVEFVNRIRDFSRRDQEAPVTAPLSITVETALLFLRPKLSTSKVRVHAPPRTDAPIVSHVPSRITQAITNAVGNAIEALEGKGNIWIRYAASDSEVSVSIEDDGPGMSDDLLARTRQPFFTTKKTGTGLGMSVMHDVMRAHKGRVELLKGQSGGLCVRLVLPQHPEDNKKF